jgi:hypothetical protein
MDHRLMMVDGLIMVYQYRKEEELQVEGLENVRIG